MFVINFSLRTTLDGVATDFAILSGTTIPIPTCDNDLPLPGDGSVQGFLRAIGDYIGQLAVERVLSELDLQVFSVKYLRLMSCTSVK